MLEVLFCALVSTYGFYRYVRSYRSKENWQSVGTSYKGKKHVFANHAVTYGITFAFGPAFGAAALFIVYQELGGAVNFLSIFLLMLGIVLGPLLLMDRFKARKHAT
jgi:hypothetical protein